MAPTPVSLLTLSVVVTSLLSATASHAADGPRQRSIVTEYQFERLDEVTMRTIADEFSVHDRDGDTFRVYVPAHRSHEFEALAPAAALLDADIDSWMHDGSLDDTSYIKGYESYDEINAIFAQYETDHPDFVQVMDLPWMKTEDGQTITVLKMSSNVQEDNLGSRHCTTPAPTLSAGPRRHGGRLSRPYVVGSGPARRPALFARESAILAAPRVRHPRRVPARPLRGYRAGS